MRKETRLAIIALTLSFFLSSCSTIPRGDSGFYVPVYSQERREALHKELVGNDVPQAIEFLKDYKVLRDQVRVTK